ncbi:hypothetical protein C2G38_2045842 [Gigaspora rosea]|uniref:Uncharacterized protein n=1 Tax=Gigaspora rosea TaxID=44941 RepID=A0A397UBS6_9GLOM|nr:hypothetical protein C2G38_2045842 [Gigaspora rosea]
MVFLQQPQTVYTSSQSEPYQPLKQNIQGRNFQDWKTPSTPSIICPQHLSLYFQIFCQYHKEFGEPEEELYFQSIPEKSNGSISSQECIAKSELDRLIDRYLEALDNFIPKSRKGRKAENENKEYKEIGVEIYHKEFEKNEDKLFENELKKKIKVDNEFTKSTMESDKYGTSALPYAQRPAKAINTDHMIGVIKSRFKNRVDIEKEVSREYQESETKLNRKRKL